MRDKFSLSFDVVDREETHALQSRIGLDATRQIARVIVDPRNANTVFVAALGNAYGPSADRGVYRSTDGGRSWLQVIGSRTIGRPPSVATGATRASPMLARGASGSQPDHTMV